MWFVSAKVRILRLFLAKFPIVIGCIGTAFFHRSLKIGTSFIIVA
jgi:hypothetical protein